VPVDAVVRRLVFQRAVKDGRGAGIFILATLRRETANCRQV
jgi:hypothetical protein